MMKSEREDQLWAGFVKACDDAEGECKRVQEEAARDRDRILQAWQDKSRHVHRAAQARYTRAEEAARVARDEKLKKAEEVLMKGLDDCEEEQRQFFGS